MENTPTYDIARSFQEWERVPWADSGYLTGAEVLAMNHVQFAGLLQSAFNAHFSPRMQRNRNNSLIQFMRPRQWGGKGVLDYGCGYGGDSLQFALAGARVSPADMHPTNLLAVRRAFAAFRLPNPDTTYTLLAPPWFTRNVFPDGFDLFWSCGVLHHFPHASEVLREACRALRPGGECRILLYSDRRWRMMCHCDPPDDTVRHPQFRHFIKASDPVGHYADWYDRDKLARLVAGFATVEECHYLFDDHLIGAVIVPRRPGPVNGSS